MTDLNKKQEDLCNQTDDFVLVDAGPGTGKTSTIVERYVTILNKNVDPLNVLMLTFTNNAAEEMRNRITVRVTELVEKGEDPTGSLAKALKNMKVSTIDSFCLEIVLNSPETIRDFFDPEEDDVILSRSASLFENESLNKQYFADFYARFIRENGEKYVSDDDDIPTALGLQINDIFELICKLMARGIMPKKKKWYGYAKDLLIGTKKELKELMKKNPDKVSEELERIRESDDYVQPDDEIDIETAVDEAIDEDRELLLEFIHDVYYGYIIQSIKDNRLTFGLCELFAFIVLMNNTKSRKLHSVDYLTIDEFQDTNELQMKICLLTLNKPNFCAVGDWKQGIFGFRYVSIDNILRFKKRYEFIRDELENFGISLPFKNPEIHKIGFDKNYRSTQKILDIGFASLDILYDGEVKDDEEVTPLMPEHNDYIGEENTDFRCIKAKNKEEETVMAVDQITDYVKSGNYQVIDVVKGEDGKKKGVPRKMEYGDIAVLCRKGARCKMVLDECRKRGIPAFLQDDVEIMSSREGKLVLAWLRYINDDQDERGIGAILADRGYSLSDIEMMMASNGERIPNDIQELKATLQGKLKRPNDLVTTIFKYYYLNNETVQSIISVISSAHEESLITVSEIIRMIQDDIDSKTKYNVDPKLLRKAVMIQTIHKSKGLEYPAVIVVGLDDGSFPSDKEDKSTLFFRDDTGVRCSKKLVKSGNNGIDVFTVLNSWKTSLVRNCLPVDFSEERRLLFVAMTRAKQYLAICGGFQPSKYFTHYTDVLGFPTTTPVAQPVDAKEDKIRTKRPVIKPYQKRRMNVSVHDLMSTIKDPDGVEKKKGQGKEHGELVHQKAYRYLRYGTNDDSVKEMKYISELIDEKKATSKNIDGEIKMVLPVDDVSIKGTIDLLVEYDDRYEIRDYKTDLDESYIDRYMLQLSIYYYAVASLGKKVDCYIDFAALGYKRKVEPYSMDYIRERIAEYKRQLEKSD